MSILITAIAILWAAASYAGANVWTNFEPEGGASRQIIAHVSATGFSVQSSPICKKCVLQLGERIKRRQA
jgi:hypothetical protein